MQKILLVGIGGYGAAYLDALLEARDPSVAIVGAVDPHPPESERYAAHGVRIFPALEDFYEKGSADLAVISSPIHLHAPQTILALRHGSAVLCEKPAAATVQEVEAMRVAQQEARRFVAVGFQWSFSRGIAALKQDLSAGRFGVPRRAKSFCLWPRPLSYYRRNQWAGRLRSADGAYVLDSPINNANAHDLHNLLYLLGGSPTESAVPLTVTAELYRANDIENCDTAALRVRTADGAELFCIAAHAVQETCNPIFELECEDAIIRFIGDQADITAERGGSVMARYPSPNADLHTRKLWVALAALREDAVIPCGLEAAHAHTLCVNGAHESFGPAHAFPPEIVAQSVEDGETLISVRDLSADLQRCYAQAKLPSELRLSWARPGGTINLRGYRSYPRAAAP